MRGQVLLRGKRHRDREYGIFLDAGFALTTGGDVRGLLPLIAAVIQIRPVLKTSHFLAHLHVICG